MDYYEDETKWTIALYTKRGRSYREVGIFWELECDPGFAYEMFGTLSTAFPPNQAIRDALQELEVQSESPLEYELRLLNSKRVIATTLWESDAILECVEDYKDRKFKRFRVVLDVEIDDDWPLDPLEWDWDQLSAENHVTVVSMEDL